MQEAESGRVGAGSSVITPHSGADVAELLARRARDRWPDRRDAADGLENLGTAAVPALVDCLRSDSDGVRWGAVKVLGEIGDPSAISALVEALEDPDAGVRWLAAQALISVGPNAFLPLLRQLVTGADSHWLQEGAHHVLRGLQTSTVRPVVQALEDRFPSLTVPVAANEALKALECGQSS